LDYQNVDTILLKITMTTDNTDGKLMVQRLILSTIEFILQVTD